MGDDESHSQDMNEQTQSSRPKRKAYTQMMNLPSDQFMWETFEMGADLSGDEKQILPANPEARPEAQTPKSDTNSGLSSLLEGDSDVEEEENPQVTTFSSLLNTGQFQIQPAKKVEAPNPQPSHNKPAGGTTVDLPGDANAFPPAPPVQFAPPSSVFPAAAPQPAPGYQPAPPTQNAAPYAVPSLPPTSPSQNAAPYAVPNLPPAQPKQNAAPYAVPDLPPAQPKQNAAPYAVPNLPPAQPKQNAAPYPVPDFTQAPPSENSAPAFQQPSSPSRNSAPSAPSPSAGPPTLPKPAPLPGTVRPAPPGAPGPGVAKPPMPPANKAPLAQSDNVSTRLPFPADSMASISTDTSPSDSLSPLQDGSPFAPSQSSSTNPFSPPSGTFSPFSPPSGTFSPFAPPRDSALSQNNEAYNPFKPYPAPNPNFDPLDEPQQEVEPSSAHPVLKRAVDITRPQLPQLEMPGSKEQQSHPDAQGFAGRLKKFCAEIGSAFKNLFNR